MITAARNNYRFADITLQSNTHLGGLVAADEFATPDVTITVRPPRRLDCRTEFGRCAVSADGTLTMDLPPVGRFHLSATESSIVVEPFADVGESIMRHVVVDLALSRWLAMKGRPALHATAVQVGGAVVAFLAASGGGKSTLSGALVANGDRWVADDLLLLDVQASQTLAIPTVVSTRLLADSACALGVDRDAGEVIAGSASKRRWEVEPVDKPSPLTCMFFLDRREGPDGDVVASPMANHEVLAALAVHWFLTGTGVVAPLTFLTTMAALVRTTRMLRLSYPSSYSALPQVIDVVRREASVGVAA